MDMRTADKTCDIFVVGLCNAQAMENEALGIMKPQLKRIENYPQPSMGHTLAGGRDPREQIHQFAFENFEIAAYNSLPVLSEAGQFPQAIEVLQQNLVEEEAMAEWLRPNLADVTRRYAQLSEAGETEKM